MTAPADETPEEATVVMSADAIATALKHIAHRIVERNPSLDSVGLMGILSRGRPLADRLAAQIELLTGTRPRVGSLATTLYRDDIRSGRRHSKLNLGETHFDFDVDGMTVVLVDDVISKGRTVRAALDEVFDYGRPARIQLACLIDRGLRELPVQPDFLGWSISTEPEDHVAVRLTETDGTDMVLLTRNDAPDSSTEEAK